MGEITIFIITAEWSLMIPCLKTLQSITHLKDGLDIVKVSSIWDRLGGKYNMWVE